MSATVPGAPCAHLPYLIVLLGACAAPPPRPLDLERLADGVAVRDATPEELERALDLVGDEGLGGLGLERPVLDPAVPPDCDRAPLWHASALAFNGALRDARRRFAEAAGNARAAGAPESMRFLAEERGVHSDDWELNVALTFDVLGLLDAGRAAAARALADAEARTAWADVERAAWAAELAVDRARAELATSHARTIGLAALLREVEPSLRRAELLYEADRLADGEIERLRAMALEVEHVLHVEIARAAMLRRAVADAAGLAPTADALDRITPRTLTILFAELDEPSAARDAAALAALLERNPDARRARLGYALAEARLRDEAARGQPGLRLGPRAVFGADSILPGGVLMLDLPHGSAVRGRVDAAAQGRERAREALEETLRAAWARLEEARTRYRASREALELHALPRDAATERALVAARARFDVDPRGAEALGMALQERARALIGALDVRLSVVLAALDGRDAAGPEPAGEDDATGAGPVTAQAATQGEGAR